LQTFTACSRDFINLVTLFAQLFFDHIGHRFTVREIDFIESDDTYAVFESPIES